MTGIRPVSLRMIMLGLRSADILWVGLWGILARELYLGDNYATPDQQFLPALAIAMLLTANIFYILELYGEKHLANFWRQATRLTLAWLMVAAILIAIAFVTKVSANFSRAWSIIWLAGGLFGFFVFRIVLRHFIIRWKELGRLTRGVIVIGSGPVAERLIDHLRRIPAEEIAMIGVFDDTPPPDNAVGGIPWQGTIDDLLIFARTNRIDQVIIARPWSQESEILELLRRIWALPVDIRLAPDMVGYRLAHCAFGTIGDIPVINVFDRPLSDEKLLIKRGEDILLAGLMFLVFAPLMLLVAIAIKLDSRGPVFFSQQRWGFNHRVIQVLKFRTMFADDCVDLAPKQVQRNDPRVTRIGAFLRRTSLDELPQLFNVLAGSMSIVGPRPHSIGMLAVNVPFEEAVDEYAARHRVKPGLTGWAQVNGWRGEIDSIDKMQRRVEHDLYYIENWSLALDIRIIAMTVLAVLRGRNAW